MMMMNANSTTNNNNSNSMDPKFYAELKQLNEDLIKFLQQSQEKSVHLDFTPTLEDYIKQFKALEKQYPASSAQQQSSTGLASTTTTTTTTAAFAAAATTTSSSSSSLSTTTTTTSSITAPLFSSTASLPTSNSTFSMPTTTQPFLFGAPPTAFSSSTGSSTTTTSASPFFSFVTSAGLNNLKKPDEPAEDGAAAGGDDDEVHQPPEPEIDKYEEPNSKYSVKCKLYERVRSGDLNLMGIGTLYVKTMEAGSGLQVIVRQDPDLRRVLLNEVVIPSIPVKLLPKAVQMVFPNAAGEIKFYIAKLKDEAEAQVLFETLKQS